MINLTTPAKNLIADFLGEKPTPLTQAILTEISEAETTMRAAIHSLTRAYHAAPDWDTKEQLQILIEEHHMLTL